MPRLMFLVTSQSPVNRCRAITARSSIRSPRGVSFTPRRKLYRTLLEWIFAALYRLCFSFYTKNTVRPVAGVCALRVGLVAKGNLSAPDRLYFSTPITRSSGLPSLARKLIGSQVRQWILLNAFGERFLSSLKTHPPRSLGSVRCSLVCCRLVCLGE